MRRYFVHGFCRKVGRYHHHCYNNKDVFLWAKQWCSFIQKHSVPIVWFHVSAFLLSPKIWIAGLGEPSSQVCSKNPFYLSVLHTIRGTMKLCTLIFWLFLQHHARNCFYYKFPTSKSNLLTLLKCTFTLLNSLHDAARPMPMLVYSYLLETLVDNIFWRITAYSKYVMSTYSTHLVFILQQ